ncbi:MAG: hydroxyacid dehydrogenase [Alphaproteobacteria bacterium]|nr:hydroxyacid dehydrogenase [Alphaproteobacteria bacterium]
MVSAPTIVVTFDPGSAGRAVIAEALGGVADAVYLPDRAEAEREAALQRATIVLSHNTAKELRPGEASLLAGAKLVQFMTAGVDFIPLDELPSGVPVASNGGAYAEPMAEHALAMTLAAIKRLLIEHTALTRGTFNQFTMNRMLAGRTCGILGFGGIGAATARLMRAVGMKVHAINRGGRTEEKLDWLGTPDRLDELLAAADVLVISLPLTRSTQGMIGVSQLARMKRDAILVNLARGEIVDEAALYAHLRANPEFTACIDAWWVEPVRHGVFRVDYPFLELPNVIGSPHNSGSVPESRGTGLRRALANCRRVLEGEVPLHLVGDDDRL